MSEAPPPPPDSSAERAAEAATRRRWITLAEFVAVAGLLIGALTLWLNWSDRREDSAKQAAAAQSESKARGIVTLTGTVEDDGAAIALADATHSFSGATVRFPDALGVGQQDAMPGPRIRADWFAAALLKLTDGGPDEREGRLPVLIAVQWWDGATRREDVALYDVLWRIDGRMLQGRRLRLTGLVLRERTGSGAALAAWNPRA